MDYLGEIIKQAVYLRSLRPWPPLKFMTESKFVFEPGMPGDLKAIIEPICRRYEWLVPTWCHRVHVRYFGQSPEGNTASCETSKPYRWAIIRVHGHFIEADERERRQNIVHELLHIPTAPTMDYVRNTFALLFNDGNAPKFKEHVLSCLTDHYEAAVQDLAERILAFEDSLSTAHFMQL